MGRRGAWLRQFATPCCQPVPTCCCHSCGGVLQVRRQLEEEEPVLAALQAHCVFRAAFHLLFSVQIRRQREEEERVKAEEKAKAQAMVRMGSSFVGFLCMHFR